MRNLLIICAGLLVIGIIGCAQVEQEAPPDYDQIRADLEEAQYEYAEAWNNKDMNKISEIWSHDADITIWGPGERARIQGWDGPNGVKAWYEAAMEPMDTVDFKIQDLLVKVGRDGKSAVVTYYVENDFVDKEGNAGKMTPRVTVIKEIQDGVWKQIHGDASFSIAEIQEMQ